MKYEYVFREIDSKTIRDLQELLYLRNKTSENYVSWKYGITSPNGFHGYIAYVNDEAVGCFGSIPLCGITNSGERLDFGWFADWYVKPDQRSFGLGSMLLNQLLLGNSHHVGHPGPKNAQRICFENNWKKIYFQAKFRWIKDKDQYYRIRSSTKMKAKIRKTVSIIIGLFSKIQEMLSSFDKKFTEVNIQSDDGFYNWIVSQPCPNEIKRVYGVWNQNGIFIYYCDQFLLKTKELYRKVIYISPIEHLSIQDLANFLSFCNDSSIAFVELLTGSRKIAKECGKLGGTRIAENPIICQGFTGNLFIPNLQGLHRENWLFEVSNL